MTQGAEFPAFMAKQYDYDAHDLRAGWAISIGDFMEDDEESVIGFDALYRSMLQCRKGVLWKDSVAAFYHRGVERTEKLCQELHNGKYKAAPPKHFVISSPKRREIASVAFRDRIYQRSLNDNLVYPIMTRSFIYDNWACQTGKGTDPARARMKEFLRRYYRRHGTEGWVAQFDIHGYYPNMRHDVAEDTFRKKLPGWAFDRVQRILREQYEGDTGYNPGSQLIQIAGISLLNDLDHIIKERMRVKYCIRYMDDLVMIHQDRGFLEECMQLVIAELGKLGFEINQKKTRIYPLSEGILFLGFIFRLTDTGKVLMHPDPGKIKTARKKYRRLVSKAKRGKCSRENVDASWATWIDHISKGNSYRLIQRLNKFYSDLWKGDGKDDPQETHDDTCRNGCTGECGSSGGKECCQH